MDTKDKMSILRFMYIPFVVIANGLNFGKKARRRSWSKYYKYVTVINPAYRPVLFTPLRYHILYSDGLLEDYTPSIDDRAAKDWVFI